MISIHALHEESDIVGIVAVVLLKISIHALHEESDLSVASAVTQHLISIHALHEESDQPTKDLPPILSKFQSTLSMRRATIAAMAGGMRTGISIHALHEESDWLQLSPWASSRYFNPRSP